MKENKINTAIFLLATLINILCWGQIAILLFDDHPDGVVGILMVAIASGLVMVPTVPVIKKKHATRATLELFVLNFLYDQGFNHKQATKIISNFKKKNNEKEEKRLWGIGLRWFSDTTLCFVLIRIQMEAENTFPKFRLKSTLDKIDEIDKKNIDNS